MRMSRSIASISSRLAMALAAVAAGACIACSSGAPVVTNTLSGNYEITGIRVLPNNTGDARELTISVVSVNANRVVFDFLSGDINRPVPVRDTAVASGDRYEVTWIGSAEFNHVVSFDASTCSGSDIDGAGAAAPWATCAIRRVE